MIRRENKEMENNSRTMYLCIHALQVAPVSCINRDDTGTPKTCVYGGTSRMRVSSQCWKRAIRMYLKDKYNDSGVRTKAILYELAGRLAEATGCDSETARQFVKEKLEEAKIIAGDKKKKEKGSSKKAKEASENEGTQSEKAKDTSAFFSRQQIDALSALLIEKFGEANADKPAEEPEKKKTKEKKFPDRLAEACKNNPSASELLFGRMFASNPDLNYDAACQVAHTFSVNEVYDEPDYFTVVGDIKKEETGSGSDYLDTKLFNSGILYRFADVNLSQGSELRNEQYMVDAAQVASQFLEAFVLSMPTGSANAYANMTVPETVIVELRDDVPVSFAPAFAKAIEGDDICGTAISEMAAYEDKISRLYGAPVRKWVLGEVSLKELCRQVEEEINGRL